MHYDVVVVGAGPAGSMAAKYAAKHGARTILLEEHPSIGTPTQCAGLLSTRAIHECEISPEKVSIRGITGALAYSPSGLEVPVVGGEVKAHVVDRHQFDQLLAENAIRAGARVMVKARCTSIHDNVINVIHEGQDLTIRADVVILAEGVGAHLAHSMGIPGPEKVLSGAQLDVLYEPGREDYVEVFTGDWAPGLFAWAIPINNKTARVGLCAHDNALPRLQRLLGEHPVVSKRYGGPAGNLVVGGVPLGPPPHTTAPGTLVVGDAAAQVKPTSGGGVYMGALSAKIAGRVAARAALEEDSGILSEYEAGWRERIMGEIRLGMRVNRALESMDTSTLDDLFEVLGEPEVQRIITEYGDMDHPSKLIKKLVFSPAAPKLMPILGRVVRSKLL